MRRLTAMLMLLLLTTGAYSQELKVKSMQVAQGDLSASTQPRLDLQKNPCGLVKVQLAVIGAQFDGNIIGNVEYKTGEYWVYMTQGAYLLQVKHPSYLPLMVNFRDHGIKGVEPKTTYNLIVTKPQSLVNEEEDGANYLLMDIQPQTCTVLIDGKTKNVTDGKMSIRLPYGSYKYTVMAEGYATKTGTVQIGMTRCEENVRLESVMASVRVTCATTGTQIYVNDQPKGAAPWSGQLTAGVYRIEARKAGYHSQTQSVQLSEREQRTVELPQLVAMAGRLDVNYTPMNAEVYIDGSYVGKSPEVFRNIAIGSHEVEIRATGYTSKKETVTIKEGQTTPIAGALTKIPSEDAEAEGLTANQLNTLGDDYYNGRNGKQKDYVKAVKYYRKSAEQGNAYGQCFLGYMYENGYGVTQDKAEAVKWYRKAAEQGNATAQSNLGYMYDMGYGVTQDKAEAVKWYRKAAEQGNARAQCNLGYMYEKGYGVTQDYAEAIKWYRKAAEQGNAQAQSNLGSIYYNGYGVTQDYAEAVKWFRKAADQGNITGQEWMGCVYQRGHGVPKDLSQAKYWYQKAIDQGSSYAKERLAEINK